MKKSLISLLLLFSLLIFPYQINAEENTISGIDYQLPYPGILPGSSFYPLKVLRDQIAGFLIGKPLEKAEFNLSKSDTRLSAAISLIEQKKGASLVEDTLSKAEDYFSESLDKTREAKSQGIDTRDFVKILASANIKHQEIVEKIEKKISQKDGKKIELVKKRIQKLGGEIKKLR